MKLSEKLDGWINYLESIDAPKPPEPSIARDYPEAWKKLQKRRRLLKVSYHLLMLMVLGLILLGCVRVLLPNGEAAFQHYRIYLLIPGAFGFVLGCFGQELYCPRCEKLFNHPSTPNYIELIEGRPDAKCMHCGLLIGEKEVNGERKKS